MCDWLRFVTKSTAYCSFLVGVLVCHNGFCFLFLVELFLDYCGFFLGLISLLPLHWFGIPPVEGLCRKVGGGCGYSWSCA